MSNNAVHQNQQYCSIFKQEDKISGRDWLKYSISIWNDIKTKEEKEYKHPAAFPVAMIQKLVRLYTKPNETVLDPFMGSGSTLVAAVLLGRKGIGFEINEEYINTATKRLAGYDSHYNIIKNTCMKINEYIPSNSIDLCITSPPYWNVLNCKRSADSKQIKNYGNYPADIGNINDYSKFLDEIKVICYKIHKSLKPNKHCIMIVMDIRKGSKFFPFHIDVVNLMQEAGFELQDFIIWDRRKEYNNLKPLGYPWVFRVNKVHEYICIFKKMEA